MYLIILAAGMGNRLRPLTEDLPKCMVELHGRPLLDWQVDAAHAAGFDDIAVVTGYRSDKITRSDLTRFENPLFDVTNMVETLWCAESVFDDGFVVSYGDIVYEPHVLERLLESPAEISVIVDRGWLGYWKQRFENVLDDAETLSTDGSGRITDIGQKPRSESEIEGQYIGLTAFRGAGVAKMKAIRRQAEDDASRGVNPFGGVRSLQGLYMTDILMAIIDSGFPVTEVSIQRGWLEIDSLHDHEIATGAVEVDHQIIRFLS